MGLKARPTARTGARAAAWFGAVKMLAAGLLSCTRHVDRSTFTMPRPESNAEVRARTGARARTNAVVKKRSRGLVNCIRQVDGLLAAVTSTNSTLMLMTWT